MTLDEWVALVCAQLQVELPDVRDVLDLAREVAHRVERPAAPVTALLVGLASASGADVASVIAQVRQLLPPEAAGQG